MSGGLTVSFIPSYIELSPIKPKNIELYIENQDQVERKIQKFIVKTPSGLHIELPKTLTFKNSLKLDVPISCDDSCSESEHSIPLTIVLDDDETAETSLLVKITPKFIFSLHLDCVPKRAKEFDNVKMIVHIQNEGYLNTLANLSLELFDPENNSVFKDSKNFNTDKSVSLEFAFTLEDVPNDNFKPGMTTALISITINDKLVHSKKFDAFELMKKIDLAISDAYTIPSGSRYPDGLTILKCTVNNNGYKDVDANVVFELKDSNNEIFMSNSNNPLKLSIPSQNSKLAELILSSLTPEEPLITKKPSNGKIIMHIKVSAINPSPSIYDKGTAETEIESFEIKPDFDLKILQAIPSAPNAISGSSIFINIELFNNGAPIKPELEIKPQCNGSYFSSFSTSFNYTLQSYSFGTRSVKLDIPKGLHGPLSLEIIAHDSNNKSNSVRKFFNSILNIIDKSNLDSNCIVCNTKIPSGKLFCPNCGYNNKSNEIILCPKCSNTVPFKAVKCPHCGYYNRSRFDKDLVKCPKCATIGRTDKYCTNCGTKLPKPRSLNEIVNSYAKGFSAVKDLEKAIKLNTSLLYINPNARLGLLQTLINKLGELASKKIGKIDLNSSPSFNELADIIEDLLNINIREDFLSDELKQHYSKIESLRQQIYNKKLKLAHALVKRDEIFKEFKDNFADVFVDELNNIPFLKDKLFDLALTAGLGPYKAVYDSISMLINKAKLIKSVVEYIESNQEIKELESEISQLEQNLISIS
ncbi:MAG: hypothetical protein ACTSPQ_20260 [Candidatus Helarchaeota archaeon]